VLHPSDFVVLPQPRRRTLVLLAVSDDSQFNSVRSRGAHPQAVGSCRSPTTTAPPSSASGMPRTSRIASGASWPPRERGTWQSPNRAESRHQFSPGSPPWRCAPPNWP